MATPSTSYKIISTIACVSSVKLYWDSPHSGKKRTDRVALLARTCHVEECREFGKVFTSKASINVHNKKHGISVGNIRREPKPVEDETQKFKVCEEELCKAFGQQFRSERLLKIHDETRHQWIKNISPKEREVSLSHLGLLFLAADSNQELLHDPI